MVFHNRKTRTKRSIDYFIKLNRFIAIDKPTITIAIFVSKDLDRSHRFSPCLLDPFLARLINSICNRGPAGSPLYCCHLSNFLVVMDSYPQLVFVEFESVQSIVIWCQHSEHDGFGNPDNWLKYSAKPVEQRSRTGFIELPPIGCA